MDAWQPTVLPHNKASTQTRSTSHPLAMGLVSRQRNVGAQCTGTLDHLDCLDRLTRGSAITPGTGPGRIQPSRAVRGTSARPVGVGYAHDEPPAPRKH